MGNELPNEKAEFFPSQISCPDQMIRETHYVEIANYEYFSCFFHSLSSKISTTQEQNKNKLSYSTLKRKE